MSEQTTIDLVAFVARREQVDADTAKRWILAGFVRLDAGGIWRELYLPEEFSDRILVGNQLSAAEKAESRERRRRRIATADRYKVAIGMVDPDGNLTPGAKNLKGEPVQEAA